MAFMAGLRKGDFIFTLSKKPPKSMSKLMYEAQKFMNGEYAVDVREDPPSKKRKETDDCRFEQSKPKVLKFSNTPKKKKPTTPVKQFSSFTSLNTPIDQVLMQIQEDPSLRWPNSIRLDLD